MVGNTDQTTGNNSKAYLAKRDIKITNKGMGYTCVKQLCLDLIHDNFPKLQQEAMQHANENVMDLVVKLKAEIEKNMLSIDPQKLAEPDVQAALNEAVQGAAKKGKKADLNLLASLVASRIDKGNTDLLDITIEEAIRLTPKLTFTQINFLSVKHFIANMTIKNPNVTFSNLEQFAMPALAEFGSRCAISVPNIQYLAGIGMLDFQPILSHDSYDIQHRSYPTLAKDLQGFKDGVKNSAPCLRTLLETYNKENFAASTLSSFGQVVAITSLRRVYGDIDLKIWIK